MAGLDSEVVKHALKVARENGFAEVELSNGEAQFRATLEPSKKRPKSPSGADANESSEPANIAIKSPQVGYYKPADTPLAVGQTVEKGQVVAAISALGLLNDVESNVSGEVVEVLVSDGDPVQFGQPLVMVRP